MYEGQTCRFYCPACEVHFDVTLEPTKKGQPRPEDAKSLRAIYCPFCDYMFSIYQDEDVVTS